MEAKQPLFDEHGNLTLDAAHRYSGGNLSGDERLQVEHFLEDSGLDADVLDDFDGAANRTVAASTARVNERVAAATHSGNRNRRGLLIAVLALLLLGVVSWFALPFGDESGKTRLATNSDESNTVASNPDASTLFDSVSIGQHEATDTTSWTENKAPKMAEPDNGTEQGTDANAKPTSTPTANRRNHRPNVESESGGDAAPTAKTDHSANTTTASPESEMVWLRFAISSEPVYKNDKQREKNAATERKVGQREERAIMEFLKTNAFKPEGLLRGGRAVFFVEITPKGTVASVRTAEGYSPKLDLMMVDLLSNVNLTGTDEKVETIRYRVLVTF